MFIPKSSRIEYFRDNFGFICSCSECIKNEYETQRSDYRRKKLFALQKISAEPIDINTHYSLHELDITGRESSFELINMRIKLLEEEEIATPATLYACERDVFFDKCNNLLPWDDMIARRWM